MEAAASLVCSKVTPLYSTLAVSGSSVSFGHFNSQLRCRKASSVNNSFLPRYLRIIGASPKTFPPVVMGCSHPFYSHSVFQSFSALNSGIIRPVGSVKCLYSSSMEAASSEERNPWVKWLKDFSFESLKSSILQLTPIDICKWCLVLYAVIAASKWTWNLLFNPFFWMYFSWTWLMWPWMVAVAVAIYGLYSLRKHMKGKSSLVEQFAIVTSAFTWLTLVPPAHVNGFLEGWPLVFFFVYHYFFFLNASVRKRLYGDYYPREHDPKWDISLPNWQKLLYCVGVMVGHWLAAYEGKELHLVPGGWHSVPIWVLIMTTIFMQYHSTLYLAKYSEKVVVPTAVVQFGPYRFVRHPIYASTILLFAAYFTALGAPLSVLFIVGVCLLYYGKKAKLEEALMVEAFGESYKDYMSQVRYKLIPLLY